MYIYGHISIYIYTYTDMDSCVYTMYIYIYIYIYTCMYTFTGMWPTLGQVVLPDWVSKCALHPSIWPNLVANCVAKLGFKMCITCLGIYNVCLGMHVAQLEGKHVWPVYSGVKINVWMSQSVHAYIYVCIYIYIYIYICIYIYIYIMGVCTHTPEHLHTHVHIHGHIHLCMCIWMCLCI